MKHILVLALLVAARLLAEEKIHTTPENNFLTTTDYSIAPKVNPVTGEYCEQVVDYVVAGIAPLSVRRFYGHMGPYEPRYASWRYNPETYCVANLDYDKTTLFSAVGQADGSICSFDRSAEEAYTFHFTALSSFAHFQPSGQDHPLNTKIYFRRAGDPKDDKRFQFVGAITDGRGGERIFCSDMHSWVTTHKKKKWDFTKLQSYEVCTSPTVWTPYQLPVTQERLPNGNILCYTYTKWKEGSHPRPKLLEKIVAYNSTKTKILGWLEFSYPRIKGNEVGGICIQGSDGRSAFIQHAERQPILLSSASGPGAPVTRYAYNNGRLCSVQKPDGRTVDTHYNAAGKVSTQNAPVGPSGEMCYIGWYEYHPDATVVYDAEGNTTIYRFDNNKRVIAFEVHQGGTLYSATRYHWDLATGNLARKTVEDARGIIFQDIEYQYDKNQNPICVKTNGRSIHYTYSNDSFNLKLTESDREGKVTCYSYVPGTSLLASEIVYEREVPCQATTYEYDDCAICVQKTIDDGVTHKVTKITPRYELPCFGLPEIIDEGPLGKVHYIYTHFGKVAREDHFDGEGLFRFSIVNGYDEQERLISTTDALGGQTTFTYDVNHNLISISGPRPDQRREITYDKANRPIRIADWQSDGAPLITEKRYNKLGLVIEEINPYKKSTRYTYDCLGRVTMIIYPDGAIERKEYDIMGNVTKEIDPLGYETRKAYNPFGQVLHIFHPDGSEEHFTYNSTGTVDTYTDKNGAITKYSYDIFDHVIKTEGLRPTSATWSPLHKLSETEGDLTSTYTYDTLGRKISEQKAYKKAVFSYDAMGRLTLTQDEEGCHYQEYDDKGRLLETRVEIDGFLQKQERFGYDAADNQIYIIHSNGFTETQFDSFGKPRLTTDPLGNKTHHSYFYGEVPTETTVDPKGVQTLLVYDPRGRLASRLKKNCQGEIIQETENRYDSAGNLLAVTHTIFSGVTPIKTVTHRWEYGPMGRIEKFLEAGEKETRYEYDDKGRLKSLTKANGTVLEHEYDELGRLKRFYSSDFDYGYIYDQQDRVTEVHDTLTQAKTHRVYDPLGNILSERMAHGLDVYSTYDCCGRRTLLELPDHSTIAYAYNGLFLSSIRRGSYTHHYSDRNLEGQITQALLPGTLGKILIDRDPLGRYRTLTTRYFKASYLNYDPVGNLVSYAYEDPLGENACSYEYDSLDQLVADNTHTYRFDSLNNRLKKDDETYEVNALCQVAHDGKVAYAYDACGNLLSDGVRTYTYDSLDRLIAIEGQEMRVEYRYDPFHRRLSKTIFVGGVKCQYIRYLWDGEDEIGAIDESGSIKELRVLGEGLGAEIGAAVLYEIGEQAYLPIHDHRGCLVTLVDLQNHLPKETYRYTAFGEELTGGTFSPWRFSSKRVDEETGLVFFGRRYYHPALGRWITQDPQGFEDGPNLYAYVHNNPMLEIDLHGLFGVDQMVSTALNLLGLPGLFMKLIGLGRPEYINFESNFSSYSHNGDLGLPDLKVGEIGRTNGMNNKHWHVLDAATELSKMAGGVNIHYTHNRTHGPHNDLHEIAMNLRGKKTGPESYIQKRWDRYFDQNPPPKAPYYEEGHSQGVLEIKLALETYPKERRDRIIVRAFAPAAYIRKELCMDVKHFVSDHDFVHLVDSKGRQACADTTVELKRHHAASRFFDHSISSPTFRQARMDSVREYMKWLEEKYSE